MNFFREQERARRESSRLIWYFVASIAVIVVAIDVAGAVALSMSGKTIHLGHLPMSYHLSVIALVLLVVAGGALWQISQLNGGGHAVAAMVGGRLIGNNTRDYHERRLLNVVEEMAIASGIAIPAVYVLEGEQGLNAFAAGFSPNEAVVAVTRGLLVTMNRDQLQGVVGHEMSHILNGDMRLNIRLLAMLHGLLVVYLLGRYVTEISARSRDRGVAPFALFGLAVIALGWLGVLLGRIIQAAVSRQREFLADASSVQFTRNPDGIGLALRKLAGASRHSLINNSNAEKVSYMCLGATTSGMMHGLWATHPPIEERIRKIYGRSMPPEIPKEEPPADSALSSATIKGAEHQFGSFKAEGLAQAAVILGAVGQRNDASMQHAQHLARSLPVEFESALRDPHGARLIVYAAMINLEGSLTELEPVLARITDAAERDEVKRHRQTIASLGRTQRISIVELACPALRQLPAPDRMLFLAALKDLAFADNRLDPAELLLFTIIRHRIEMRPRAEASKLVSLSQIAPVLAPVLALLANCSQLSNRATAFAAGAAQLKTDVGTLVYIPPERQALQQISAGFALMRNLKPLAKEIFLTACVTIVLHDSEIGPEEIEILRAFCAVLDVPFPSVLEKQAA